MKAIKLAITQSGDNNKIFFSDIEVFAGNKRVENDLERIIRGAIELPPNLEIDIDTTETQTIGVKPLIIKVKYKGKEAKTFETNLLQVAFKRNDNGYSINSSASITQIKNGMEAVKSLIKEVEDWANKIFEIKVEIEV